MQDHDDDFDSPFPVESGINPIDYERFMRWLREAQRMPELSESALEFFANNWQSCVDGLLSRSSLVRVVPDSLPAPMSFHFAFQIPYKAKLGPHEPVVLMPGPIRGEIHYRQNMFEEPDGPTIAVLLDRRQGYFSPHYSRERGFLCIGDETNLPRGPLPLDQVLENHIYPILSYQNRHPRHTADIEASHYFACDPDALQGIVPALPLY
jgi:hypothetical protein